MNSSSQQQSSLDDLLNDTIIIGGATGSDTFTITLDSGYLNNQNMHYSAGAAASTITLTGGSSFTLGSDDTIDIGSFNWGDPQEWVDSFPSWDKVQDMCKKYPGLEIALRNFQTIYTLVKDDYDNPTPKK